jgi:hypothetical protein
MLGSAFFGGHASPTRRVFSRADVRYRWQITLSPKDAFSTREDARPPCVTPN